jgi:hypothetical protein
MSAARRTTASSMMAARIDAAWRVARGEKVDPVVPRLFHGDKPPRCRPQAASS